MVTQSRIIPVDESDGENGSARSGIDPHQSKSLGNSLSHFNENYVAGAGSGVEGTQQKKFEEQDATQSDDSSQHTPDQPSKRQRFTPSPLQNSQIVVGESDSDGIERDDLFASRPRKRGFKRPRQPWSLVKEWPLSDYGREIVFEEINAICEQSLDDAGGKAYADHNPRSIGGFRLKQVSEYFPFILITDTYRIFSCVPELRAA